MSQTKVRVANSKGNWIYLTFVGYYRPEDKIKKWAFSISPLDAISVPIEIAHEVKKMIYDKQVDFYVGD